jgi:hypothetical protein
MTAKLLELDRKTFDIIQSNLAANGHEAAAGYMVKMAHDFGRCFKTRKVNINLTGTSFSEEDIQRLVDELRK